MARTSLLKLSELLRPFIQGETTKDYFSVSNSTLFEINIIFILSKPIFPVAHLMFLNIKLKIEFGTFT